MDRRDHLEVNEIARAQVAALENLGLNGANTGMGAIEVLAEEVKAGSERIASGLERIADGLESVEGIATALHRIADSLEVLVSKPESGEHKVVHNSVKGTALAPRDAFGHPIPFTR